MVGLIKNVFGGASSLVSGPKRVKTPEIEAPPDAATQVAIDAADQDLANINVLQQRRREVAGRQGTILTGITDNTVSDAGNIQSASGGNPNLQPDPVVDELQPVQAIKPPSTQRSAFRRRF